MDFVSCEIAIFNDYLLMMIDIVGTFTGQYRRKANVE